MLTDRIVFFGDSWTDDGEIYALTSELLTIPFPLDSAGYEQTFSNGPVYAQQLPDLLGISNVQNYGVGAAQAVGVQPIRFLLERNGFDAVANPSADPTLLDFDINLVGQVDRFLAENAAAPFSGTTNASFLIGLNDLAAFAGSVSEDPFDDGFDLLIDILVETAIAAETLVETGAAQTVTFYTFPDATFFPFSQLIDPDLLLLADLLFEQHAFGLEGLAADFADLGVPTNVVSLDALAEDVVADPGTFGYLDIVNPELLGAASDPIIDEANGEPTLFFPTNPFVADLDVDQFVWKDFLHPNTDFHGLVAAFSAASLTKDEMFFGDDVDRLNGGVSDEFILSRDGDDALRLRAGDDAAFGGLGDDRIFADGGDDIISGGSGNDRLLGNGGNDVISGGAGDDVMRGGAGHDILVGGLGVDIAHGGVGDDVFFYTDPALFGGETEAAADRLLGGAGSDTLFLAVSDAERESVEAEIATGGNIFGVYNFETLGLVVRGIEEIVLAEDRLALRDVEVDPAVAGNLEAADLWGFL